MMTQIRVATDETEENTFEGYFGGGVNRNNSEFSNGYYTSTMCYALW